MGDSSVEVSSSLFSFLNKPSVFLLARFMIVIILLHYCWWLWRGQGFKLRMCRSLHSFLKALLHMKIFLMKLCNSPEKQVSVGIATKKVETCSKMLKVFWFTPFWFVPLQWIITNLFYLLIIYWVAYQLRLVLQSGVTQGNSCFYQQFAIGWTIAEIASSCTFCVTCLATEDEKSFMKPTCAQNCWNVHISLNM